MKYFALFYDVVDNFAERRMPFRESHLGLINASHDRGDILMAGALGDPLEQALIVFNSPDAGAAEDFARNDPYVKEGLVRHWQVKPWNVVVGGQR